MLGLGRALGETVALLIILRGTQKAFGWSLFDGGSTFATKIAATTTEFGDRFKAGAYIAAGLVLFLLTFVVNAAARRRSPDLHRDQNQTTHPMTSMLDRPLKPRTFPGSAGTVESRTLLRQCLVTLSMVIALTPLVWVLCSVIAKGIKVVTSSVWWTHSQAGMTAFVAGGGAYHAVVGTDAAGTVVCRDLDPDRPLGRDLLGRIRRRQPCWPGWSPSWWTFSPACLRSWRHCSSTHCGWRRSGLPRSELAVALALVLLMLPVIVRATEEMLRIVPVDLREASYALGVSKWKTIARIVIPTGLSGIVTGIMLAVARVLGETAPLLILVGYSRTIEFRRGQRIHGVAARHDV